MKIFLQRDGQQIGPYTEDYLRSAVISGEINQFDLAQPEGADGWRPLCNVMHITTSSAVSPIGSPPLSALGTPLLQPPSTTDIPQLPSPPIEASPHSQSALPPPDFTSPLPTPEGGKPLASSASAKVDRVGFRVFARQAAVIGGWFCFVAGLVVMLAFSLPFYVHYAFFVAALLFSIELMYHPEAKGGLLLLLVTVLVPSVFGFGLLFYQINYGDESLLEPLEKVDVDPNSVKAGVR